MARTQLTGRQINDSSVSREDLDSTTVGQSVIKKLIAGSNITITQTGVDSGTGDVTINTSNSSILQLTDVDFSNLKNGSSLVYDLSTRTFKFVVINTSQSIVPEEDMKYAKRIDFVADTIIYKGEATVGSVETESVWRICKVSIASDFDISETWADGNSNYDNSWANRLTYAYS